MAYNFWWIFFNKSANFLLLCGVCAYIVRGYMYPFIRETLQAKALRRTELQEEFEQLLKENNDTIRALDAQKRNTKTLLEKIELWKSAVALKEREYGVQKAQLEQKCTLYLKERAQGLCQDYLRKATFPKIFKATQEEVQTFFKDTQHQTEYVKKIIVGLSKGKMHG